MRAHAQTKTTRVGTHTSLCMHTRARACPDTYLCPPHTHNPTHRPALRPQVHPRPGAGAGDGAAGALHPHALRDDGRVRTANNIHTYMQCSRRSPLTWLDLPPPSPTYIPTHSRLVIVNRGWAPLKASNSPSQGLRQPQGRVTLLGVVAEGEKAS